jgi:UDP-glucose 4-epimerase
MSKPLNVLVTGGAGYIGSVVSNELLQAGHRVTVYDNLSHGYAEAVPDEARLVVGDLADTQQLERLLSRGRFDAVMHFAALIEAGESMSVPLRYFDNNTANTLKLLNAMVEHGIKRFVFSSTAALYGDPKRTPILEEDALEPTNAYGESKLLVERMLAWLHRIHGFRYASLRYFNAAGASAERGECHQPESHLIPLVLQAASGARKSISIFGNDYPTEDGTCVRDYIHILDLASAHVLALEALGERDRLVYNLGNGKGYSVREVIDVARKVTGRNIHVVEAPRRPGDPAVLVASSEKIRNELGWKPRYPELEAIIGSAWEWRQKNPAGYVPREAPVRTLAG